TCRPPFQGGPIVRPTKKLTALYRECPAFVSVVPSRGCFAVTRRADLQVVPPERPDPTGYTAQHGNDDRNRLQTTRGHPAKAGPHNVTGVLSLRTLRARGYFSAGPALRPPLAAPARPSSIAPASRRARTWHTTPAPGAA